MTKRILLIGWLAFMPLACSSAADKPQSNYSVLNLLGVDAVDSFSWNGKAVQSGCSMDDAAVCAVLAELDGNYGEDNLFIFFSNPVTLQGQLTLVVAHPDNRLTTPFVFPVQGTITPGYETGAGISRILTLAATPSTASSNGVQARLDQFKADVRDDGLTGTMTVGLLGSTPASVAYTFNLKTTK